MTAMDKNLMYLGITIPRRMTSLRRTEDGMPIPLFATWEGDKPNLTVMNMQFARKAIPHRLCWICGEKLGTRVAFVGGPLSAASRRYSEPPFHRDCAEFAMQVCPYILTGYSERKNAYDPDKHDMGNVVDANPQIFAMTITKSYGVDPEDRSFVVQGDTEVVWWYKGKLATPEQAAEAVEYGESTLRAAIEDAKRRHYQERLERQQQSEKKVNKVKATCPKLAALTLAAMVTGVSGSE